MHALTYVLSIEIALTVTVLCREASREKRGKHRVRDLEELRSKGGGGRVKEGSGPWRRWVGQAGQTGSKQADSRRRGATGS